MAAGGGGKVPAAATRRAGACTVRLAQAWIDE